MVTAPIVGDANAYHSQNILYLTLPEQHICVSREMECAQTNFVWDSFALLKLDIVCQNNTGKQRLDFVHREKTPRAVEKQWGVTRGMRTTQWS